MKNIRNSFIPTKLPVILLSVMSLLRSIPAFSAPHGTLPPGVVESLTDSKGYTWYTVPSDTIGVVREKDGVYETFTAETSGLLINGVNAIYEDRHGFLWFIYDRSQLHYDTGDRYGTVTRFDGDSWVSYYPYFFIMDEMVDEDGDFRITVIADDFDSWKTFESVFDGDSWISFFVDSARRNVNVTYEIRNFEATVIGLDTSNIYGAYGEGLPANDRFPLAVGNTWTYRRTFNDFTDTVVTKVVGTVDSLGYTWAVMLDGRAFRQDAEGNVYRFGITSSAPEYSYPWYNFAECIGDKCGPDISFQFLEFSFDRRYLSVTVPAGTYEATVFGRATLMIDGYSESLARDIGLVRYTEANDYGNWEWWELVSYDLSFVSVDDTESVPNATIMSHAHPNPFNPSTTIEFTLPSPGRVLLEVYSITGQKVAILVDGILTAGKYSVRFDGSGFASGMYFYRLRANGTVLTGKMALVR